MNYTNLLKTALFAVKVVPFLMCKTQKTLHQFSFGICP